MRFMTMLGTVSHKFIIHLVMKTTSMTEEMPQLSKKMVKVANQRVLRSSLSEIVPIRYHQV